MDHATFVHDDIKNNKDIRSMLSSCGEIKFIE